MPGKAGDFKVPQGHDERKDNMIRAGIIGSTGYAGGELVRILTGHKDVEIKWFGSRSYIDKKYASIYQNMFQIVDAVCMDDNMEELAEQVDVIFTATPQGLCASLVNEDILSKVKIIDLSADFRIKDVKVYEKWYGIEHKSPQFIEEAVYGLCEINREDIKKARLVANPGCYTTCSILTAYPLAKEGLIDMDTLIIDAKSGTSGAGRGAKVPNLFCEVNENMKAYGVASHRHTPEIEEQLGYACNKEVVLNFTPHLVPMNRGILATEYAKLTREVSYEEVKAIYDKYYGSEKFIRVLMFLAESDYIVFSYQRLTSCKQVSVNSQFFAFWHDFGHFLIWKVQLVAVFCCPTAGAMTVAGGSGVHQACPGDIAAVLFTISHLLAAA